MHVRRMADRREARDALTGRGDETGMLDELGREIEKIDLVSCFCVDPFGPKAESINGRHHGVVTWGHWGHRLQRAFQRGAERPRLW